MTPEPNPIPPNDEKLGFVRTAVERYQAPLVRYATRLVGDPDRARDVVQDTFFRLMAQTPGELNGHLAEWLFTVCRHRAFDVNRKEGRMVHFDEGAVERLTTPEPRPGSALEAAEDRAAVLRLVDHLPPNQQEVIRLKFQHGFSYEQISRITSLSVGNVGFLLHTAIQSLRRAWKAQPA